MPQSVLCHSVNPDHFQQQFRSQKQKQWKHHSSLRRSLILRLLLQLAYLAPHGRRRRRCVAASYRRLRERWNREYLSRFFVIRNFSNVGTISNRNKPKKIANWPHVKSHSLLSRSTFLIFRRALDMATAGHKIETPSSASFLWAPLQDWHSEENLAGAQVFGSVRERSFDVSSTKAKLLYAEFTKYMYILEEPIGDKTRTRIPLQGWTKDWALGCVNSPPAARESQEAGFMQPRVHSLAHPCYSKGNWGLTMLLNYTTDRIVNDRLVHFSG